MKIQRKTKESMRASEPEKKDVVKKIWDHGAVYINTK